MGNPRTVRRLGEISKKFDPDILFLLETKNLNDVVLKKLDHLRYECNLLVPPTGHGAGGLALFWKQELNLQVLNSSLNVIDTVIGLKENVFTPRLFTVIQTELRGEISGTNSSTSRMHEMKPGSLPGTSMIYYAVTKKMAVLTALRVPSQTSAPSSLKEISLISNTRGTLFPGGEIESMG